MKQKLSTLVRGTKPATNLVKIATCIQIVDKNQITGYL